MVLTGERLKIVRNEKGLSQGALAKLCNMAQSTIADLERNRNSGSAKIATIAKVLGVSALWLSEGKGEKYELKNTAIQNQAEDSIQSSSVSIPLLAATASMGNGNESHDADLVIDVLRITKHWADRTLSVSKVNNLRFIHAIGDSMHPTFNDGDILLVDTGAITVKNDSVYVLEAHERLFIKRVRQRLDGTFEISSDNPAVKTVDILNGDHQVTIKGKVVWVWNGKRV